MALNSPHMLERTAIRNLTLPMNPNLDIPPSPLGSPPSGANQKFAHFLKLKKEGIHFNSKLATSSALKNPSLLPKLMNSAGVEESQQYATTLPFDLWDPSRFPEWAYKEGLSTIHQDFTKRKEDDRVKNLRDSIEFVSASNPVLPTRGSTPGIGSRAIKGSAAERVMAGLDRERKGSPQTRSEIDPKGSRCEIVRTGEIARSPKRRKRSLSR